MLLSVLVPRALFALEGREQPDPAVFIQDVRRFKETKKSWRHPSSPLAPYLSVPFESGLGEAERNELGRLETEGKCLGVLDLLITGFTRLYPALAPAFEDGTAGGILHVALGTSRLPASVRCQARRQRREALAVLSTDPAQPISLSLALGGPQNVPEAHGPLRQLALAWFELGVLAYCRADPAAGAFILKFANRPGGMMLTGPEKAYLENGSKHAGNGPASGYWRDACIAYWKGEENRVRG